MVTLAGPVPLATAPPGRWGTREEEGLRSGGRELGAGSVAHALTRFCSKFYFAFSTICFKSFPGPPRGSSGQNGIVKHTSTFHTPPLGGISY